MTACIRKDKVLLVKGIEGLGNRMLCALTAILYARLTERRLLVDWRDYFYSNDGSNAFPRFFQCAECAPIDGIPETESVHPTIWRGHLHESAWQMRERYGTELALSADLAKLDYEDDVVVMWTYLDSAKVLRSHLSRTSKELTAANRDAVLRTLLQEDLQLHPGIRERVYQFKRRCFDKTTVGVHVRYTDLRSGLWKVLTTLNTLLTREPHLQIFLATDSGPIKRLFEENYPAVVSTPHWYASAPGLAIHYHHDRPDPMETGIEALVDLYLLAECNYLIIDTNSSFGDVARLLTRAPAPHIFDVRRGPISPVHSRKRSHRLMVRLRLYSWGLRCFSLFMRLQRKIQELR